MNFCIGLSLIFHLLVILVKITSDKVSEYILYFRVFLLKKDLLEMKGEKVVNVNKD